MRSRLFAIVAVLLLATSAWAQKKEVTYKVYDNGAIFAEVTIDGKDAWPGGHYLSDEEKVLYKDNREILDKKFSEQGAKNLAAVEAAKTPVTKQSEQKVEVTAEIEATAAAKQKAIDDQKAAEKAAKAEVIEGVGAQ